MNNKYCNVIEMNNSNNIQILGNTFPMLFSRNSWRIWFFFSNLIWSLYIIHLYQNLIFFFLRGEGDSFSVNQSLHHILNFTPRAISMEKIRIGIRPIIAFIKSLL